MADQKASSPLAQYGLKMYSSFADARKKHLEPTWNEARANFNSEFKALWKHEEGEDLRSKATPGTVRQKVMTAFSVMVDVALQGGKIAFSMAPSKRLLAQNTEAAEVYRQDIDDAKDVIDEQYAKCHADRAYMSSVMYGAMYGIAYMKRIRETYSSSGFEALEVEGIEDQSSIPSELLEFEEVMFSEEGPGMTACSNWEIYCDPEANYNPRQGQGWFHVRDVSPYFLRQKKGAPYFLDWAIDQVLDECKRRRGEREDEDRSDDSLPPYLRDLADRRRGITYRESFLRVPRQTAEMFERDIRLRAGRKRSDTGQFIAWEAPSAAESKWDGDEVWVHKVIADRHIIRYVRVDAEDNPMYSAKWEAVVDEPGGRGVAENTRLAHEGIAKTLRAIEDNTSWSENVQGIFKPRLIEGNVKHMKPGQVLIASDAAKSASDAFTQVKLDNHIEGLVLLLGLYEKYADWDSMFARITQGQVEKDAATATEILSQQENADKYTGGVIRNWDEGLVEPITTDIFKENMRDPAIERGRGDFVVQALGFQEFKDRITRIRTYRTILELALSHEAVMAEFKIRGLVEPMVAAAEIDVDTVMKTDEEKAQEVQMREEQLAAEAEQNAQLDPITAAKARKEDAQGQAALMKAEADQAKVELEAERQEREAQDRAAEAAGIPVVV